MDIESTVDLPAENRKSRRPLVQAMWRRIKKIGHVVWKWLKWPAIILAGLAACWYMLLPLLGFAIQLVFAAVSIVALCLWEIVTNPFGGADAMITFSYWPLSIHQYDEWNWGVWKLEGATVYAIGGLAGLYLAYRLARNIRAHVAAQKEAKRSHAEAEQRMAAEERERELDARFAHGKNAGAAAEQAIVRAAVLHGYRPMMKLPPIPEGQVRTFWITVRVKGLFVVPTQDHAIHWTDREGGAPEGLMGAPVYRRVKTAGSDRLAMMGVVFTLKSEATIP